MKVFAVGLGSLALAILLGAFGEHALRGRMAEDLLAVYGTAQKYHALGSVVLMVLALGETSFGASRLRTGSWLFASGLLVFCGTLYGLSFSGIRILGAVTPIGGVLMIGSCAWMAWIVSRTKPAA